MLRTVSTGSFRNRVRSASRVIADLTTRETLAPSAACSSAVRESTRGGARATDVRTTAVTMSAESLRGDRPSLYRELMRGFV